MELDTEEARILGSLVEKQLTTPQQYPLTLSALVAACNQTSNRDPVVAYSEDAVTAGLDRLKEARLVRFVLPSHGRSALRYRQVLDESLGLDPRQCALLAVLLLRGPQTVGELRLRTDRMVGFEQLDEIEHELSYMASRDEPLVRDVGRRPGQKEERWECSLVGRPPAAAAPPEINESPTHGERDPSRASPSGVTRSGSEGPLAELRRELSDLRAEVLEVRRDLDALRHSLGE